MLKNISKLERLRNQSKLKKDQKQELSPVKTKQNQTYIKRRSSLKPKDFHDNKVHAKKVSFGIQESKYSK